MSNCAPNPVFVKWLTEWRNSAKEVASKMSFVYSKALRSLKEHPNVLQTGQECRQLKGFGEKLCKRLDDRIRQYRIDNGLAIDDTTDNNNEMPDNTTNPVTYTSITEHRTVQSKEVCDYFKVKKRQIHKLTPSKTISPLRKVAKTRAKKAQYIPSEGSGAYAILVALYKCETETGVDCLDKPELQRASQEFSSSSMTAPTNGSYYSAFNSMKTLINKNLVLRNMQRYASYSLTDEGRDIASKLYLLHYEKQKIKSNENNVNDNNNESESDDSEIIVTQTIISSSQMSVKSSQIVSQSSYNSQNSSGEQFSLPANSYEIFLCIDSREQATGVNKDVRKTALMSILQQNGVKVEMRALSVGDFVWIAKQKLSVGPTISTTFKQNRKELVLDIIIERKRIDDLASSIQDRRWEEQKFRLRNCGVRKPIYLIENYGSHLQEYRGLPISTLDQAIVNAEIDGFSIQRCDSYDDTIRYLTLMTRYFESFFSDKTLLSCTREQLINKEVSANHFMSFGEFGRNSTKINNFTVTEMFAKHLLQIRGVSVSKAKVIIEHYPTLQSLLDAYSLCETEKQKQNLLSPLKCGLMQRNFGPIVSKKIYQHYCMVR